MNPSKTQNKLESTQTPVTSIPAPSHSAVHTSTPPHLHTSTPPHLHTSSPPHLHTSTPSSNASTPLSPNTPARIMAGSYPLTPSNGLQTVSIPLSQRQSSSLKPALQPALASLCPRLLIASAQLPCLRRFCSIPAKF